MRLFENFALRTCGSVVSSMAVKIMLEDIPFVWTDMLAFVCSRAVYNDDAGSLASLTHGGLYRYRDLHNSSR